MKKLILFIFIPISCFCQQIKTLPSSSSVTANTYFLGMQYNGGANWSNAQKIPASQIADYIGIISGGVTSVSVTTANGISGAVLNPTSTPAISLSLNTIQSGTGMAGTILCSAIPDPSTPATNKGYIYMDATHHVFNMKNDAGVVSNTAIPNAGAVGQFLKSFASDGTFTLGSAVTSVSGTTNRITVTGTTTPTIDIAATYLGQSSITTLGTIVTGVWNGTSIIDAYISSAATWNAKQTSTLTNGNVWVGNGSNVATSITLSGDLTISNTGVVTLKTNISLAGSPTTTTQSPLDNSTKIGTTAYTDLAIIADRSASVTLTNHRITYRTNTQTSYTTSVTLNSDLFDVQIITALTGALLFNAPSGTPTECQMLLLRVKDNGTARALTWNSIFRSGTAFSLPTTTTLGKWIYIELLYNLTDTKWDCVGVSDGY